MWYLSYLKKKSISFVIEGDESLSWLSLATRSDGVLCSGRDSVLWSLLVLTMSPSSFSVLETVQKEVLRQVQHAYVSMGNCYRIVIK